ncbi:hypothetical protein OKW43_004970 [Paraburkholderia sp. WC7.3g]
MILKGTSLQSAHEVERIGSEWLTKTLVEVMRDLFRATADNASQQNTAAAACLIVAEDKLDELECVPLRHLVGWEVDGWEPSKMDIGPSSFAVLLNDLSALLVPAAPGDRDAQGRSASEYVGEARDLANPRRRIR